MLAVREQADGLVAEMLRSSPTGLLAKEMYARAEVLGISDQSVRRAARRAGLVHKHNGNRGHFWVPRAK